MQPYTYTTVGKLVARFGAQWAVAGGDEPFLVRALSLYDIKTNYLNRISRQCECACECSCDVLVCFSALCACKSHVFFMYAPCYTLALSVLQMMINVNKRIDQMIDQ
jgi:hypothetical protein